MKISMVEVDTTQNKWEYIDTDDHSSKESKDSNVSAGTPGWAGSPPDVSLPGVQPGMVDLLTFSPVPGPPDSSQHSSVSAPWFINEPVPCSMMPGELQAPLATICVAQVMDHQQFQEGLAEFTSHITQSVVCNVNGDGQVVQVNPCELGPVFLNLNSVPTHRDDGPTQGKDVCVLGTPSQYHQTACQTSSVQPQAPAAGTAGILSRKPCRCTRSQCLKLYCQCFANGVMCSNCDCSNCLNNAEHEMERHEAIKSYLGRNPAAFRSKIAGGKSGEIKGCNCKHCGCLQNYCQCYEANIKCTSSCKCVDCRNYDNGSEIGLVEKTVIVKNKRPGSVITPGVVEAVCGCMLARAELAEQEGQSPAHAERMVLVEFGHCLTRIVEAMFKDNTVDTSLGHASKPHQLSLFSA